MLASKIEDRPRIDEVSFTESWAISATNGIAHSSASRISDRDAFVVETASATTADYTDTGNARVIRGGTRQVEGPGSRL